MKSNNNKRIKRLRSIKYKGKSSNKKNAFYATKQEEINQIKATGKGFSSKKRQRKYKMNRLKEWLGLGKRKQKEAIFHLNTYKSKPIHKRNNAHTVRNRYQKEFKVVNRKTNRLCNKVEKFIERCSQFISFAQKILDTSKLVALVRISLDGKKIVVAITNLDESINKLVKLIEIHDGGWFPTKEEYKTMIDIIKNTKEVYDTIKDIGKQVGILVG